MPDRYSVRTMPGTVEPTATAKVWGVWDWRTSEWVVSHVTALEAQSLKRQMNGAEKRRNGL